MFFGIVLSTPRSLFSSPTTSLLSRGVGVDGPNGPPLEAAKILADAASSITDGPISSTRSVVSSPLLASGRHKLLAKARDAVLNLLKYLGPLSSVFEEAFGPEGLNPVPPESMDVMFRLVMGKLEPKAVLD